MGVLLVSLLLGLPHCKLVRIFKKIAPNYEPVATLRHAEKSHLRRDSQLETSIYRGFPHVFRMFFFHVSHSPCICPGVGERPIAEAGRAKEVNMSTKYDMKHMSYQTHREIQNPTSKTRIEAATKGRHRKRACACVWICQDYTS